MTIFTRNLPVHVNSSVQDILANLEVKSVIFPTPASGHIFHKALRLFPNKEAFDNKSIFSGNILDGGWEGVS